MAASIVLECEKRTKVGSRSARKLRAAGRIPACLQGMEGKPNVDIHMDEVEFVASRRHHVHLYDLQVDGEVESAVVREVQWDALGDAIVHVEFKRVRKDVATESEVELEFYGMPKGGVLNHNVTHLTIRCLPHLIPDSIQVNVEGTEIGTRVRISDLKVPEGVEVLADPDFEVAVIIGMRAEKEEPVLFGDEGEAALPEPAAPPPPPATPPAS